MRTQNKHQVLFALSLVMLRTTSAQSANCRLTPSYPAPVTADGWEAKLVADGLSSPRSIKFDSEGGLLVIEQRTGLVHLALKDGGGTCFEVEKKTYLVNDTSLNHGLELSSDGKTIYASSSEAVFAWSYDPSGPSLGETNRTVVTGMDSGGHTSRTLMMSKMQEKILVVSRGSDGNFDFDTAELESGRSQIKAFDLNDITDSSEPYDYSTQGRLLGWGLRNSVGVGEEPVTGGIYSVENSVDEIEREGTDVHENNPGEELNYHGFLNGSTDDQGGNYGYPYCFAVWNTDIPDAGNLKVGDQFAREQNTTINDTFCTDDRVSPRLTFQAHTAPLDIKFLMNGTEAFVTFHGSWNRDSPAGYTLSSIAFSNGSPVALSDSTTSTTDILRNGDTSKCPQECVRPVGLAFDSQERLFMSSDSTGEIWVLVRTSPGSDGGSTSGTPTDSAPGATGTGENDGSRVNVDWVIWWTLGVFVLGML